MIKELENRLKKIEAMLEERQQSNIVFMNADEASEFLKIKKSYLYQLKYQRKIKCYKPGKILLFIKSDLVKWVMSQNVDTLEELAQKTNFISN